MHNPQITFTFHVNEAPLFIHIKWVLGTGSIYHVKLTNVCKYRISDKNTLIEVIHLINGKFRTPKIKYLHKAIDRMCIIHNINIPKLPLDSSILDSNP